MHPELIVWLGFCRQPLAREFMQHAYKSECEGMADLLNEWHS